MALLKTISIYVVLGLIIMGALSGAIALLVTKSGSNNPGVEIMLPTSTPIPELKVYVSGVVVAPGVYDMRQGQRLVDAIEAAGGSTQGARLSCMNLARMVKDEDHLHIPAKDEACQAAPISSTVEENAGIDLNSANLEELISLPGIGPVLSRAIIDYREQLS